MIKREQGKKGYGDEEEIGEKGKNNETVFIQNIFC